MIDERPLALVTAGAAGIGRTLVERFLEAGYSVHACDVDESALEGLRKAHPEAGVTHADVSDPAGLEHMFAGLSRLDVLVNNAGIAGPTAPVEDIEPRDWDRTLAVDLSGAFYATRLAVPLLKGAGGGSIINIASTAGLFGYPLRSPYAAAKWGLIGFTRTLAMELGPFKVRVNAICPGSVEGERIDRVIEDAARARGVGPETVRSEFIRQHSLRCFISPDDVANVALFLASEAGARISGQALAVDGHTESLAINIGTD